MESYIFGLTYTVHLYQNKVKKKGREIVEKEPGTTASKHHKQKKDKDIRQLKEISDSLWYKTLTTSLIFSLLHIKKDKIELISRSSLSQGWKGGKIQSKHRWHLPFSFFLLCSYYLFQDTGDETGCDGTATFTDVEALAGIGDDGVVGLEDHLDVVSGHDHLGFVGLSLGPVKGGSLIY